LIPECRVKQNFKLASISLSKQSIKKAVSINSITQSNELSSLGADDPRRVIHYLGAFIRALLNANLEKPTLIEILNKLKYLTSRYVREKLSKGSKRKAEEGIIRTLSEIGELTARSLEKRIEKT